MSGVQHEDWSHRNLPSLLCCQISCGHRSRYWCWNWNRVKRIIIIGESAQIRTKSAVLFTGTKILLQKQMEGITQRTVPFSVLLHIFAAPTGGYLEQFLVRFLGSVQVPSHQGRDVLCAAMHKVRSLTCTPLTTCTVSETVNTQWAVSVCEQVLCNRRSASQPPSSCLLDISIRGVKINVQDQCHSAHRVTAPPTVLPSFLHFFLAFPLLLLF